MTLHAKGVVLSMVGRVVYGTIAGKAVGILWNDDMGWFNRNGLAVQLSQSYHQCA